MSDESRAENPAPDVIAHIWLDRSVGSSLPSLRALRRSFDEITALHAAALKVSPSHHGRINVFFGNCGQALNDQPDPVVSCVEFCDVQPQQRIM